MTLLLAVISMTLAGSQKYLNYKLEAINSAETASAEEINAAEVNKKMSEVGVVQADYVKWSRILQNFLRLIPEGNQIHKIYFDKDSQKLTVQGLAATRDNFLELENNLKESDLATEIKSPISNLLYQSEINFSLEAKLNI